MSDIFNEERYWEGEILPDGRIVDCDLPGVEYDEDYKELYYVWTELDEAMMEQVECPECSKGFVFRICGECSGSGEGMREGLRCVVCKGEGEVADICENCKGIGYIMRRANVNK